jgi:CRP-like cAMP-binding protein
MRNEAVYMGFKGYYSIDGGSFKIRYGDLFESLRQPKLYHENQIIYQQGDSADSVYYLKSGKVKIYIASQSGSEKVLTTMTRGNLFGKASFFDGTPRTSSAKALRQSEIIAVDKQLMARIFQMQPDVAVELLAYLSKTIELLSTQIDWMVFEQADKRIARFLCNNDELPIQTIDLTHEEIGERIGVSRVTVSKILSQFRKNGWIETKYKEIDILNIDALKKFAYN